jgi:hypothetical protein
MSEKDAIVQRLTGSLKLAMALRGAATGELGAARQRLRAWQAVRLARTHADLLASPRFGPAASFFLTDLYGVNDLSARDAEVERVVPAMTRLLPAAALETVADAIELDALSEDLDAAMLRTLGSEVAALDAALYGRAYRTTGRREDRERQVELIGHLGHSLDLLARQPFIGASLALMRRPARLAGFGDLQSFLERGYDAVRRIGGADDFLKLIVARESRILAALFAGDDSLLDQPAPVPAEAAEPDV